MPLFHLSTEDLEQQARDTLTELAMRKHAGDVDLIRVQLVSAAAVVELFDFAITNSGVSTAPSSSSAAPRG